jgi:hypothetical protein
VNTFTRWRLAMPFIILSGLLLFATGLGAWAFWSQWSGAERAITVFLGIMFAMCVGISVSIGADRKIQDIPWMRMGTVALFIALGCGVTLARRNL